MFVRFWGGGLLENTVETLREVWCYQVLNQKEIKIKKKTKEPF